MSSSSLQQLLADRGLPMTWAVQSPVLRARKSFCVRVTDGTESRVLRRLLKGYTDDLTAVQAQEAAIQQEEQRWRTDESLCPFEHLSLPHPGYEAGHSCLSAALVSVIRGAASEADHEDPFHWGKARARQYASAQNRICRIRLAGVGSSPAVIGLVRQSGRAREAHLRILRPSAQRHAYAMQCAGRWRESLVAGPPARCGGERAV